jgi:hypothetical protein
MAIADRARDFWDRISPRERKLVVLTAIAVPITLAIWAGLSIQDGLTRREDHNEKMRHALNLLTEMKRRGVSTQPKDDPTRDIGPEPISLDTYLDNAAKKAGLTIKATQPHTPVSRNGFTTTSVAFSLDDLEIDKLKTFLHEVETVSKVVVITSLETSRDRRDRTKIDAKLVVSTYSRDKTDANNGGAAAKKGG